MSSFKLNENQQKAVNYKGGDLLIIAGAGTGKTAVLTQRIISLIKDDFAKPSEIVALTFTEKAAQEMQERVDIEMEYGYEEPLISTFHSFCDKILREDGYNIGFDGGYTLMSLSLIHILEGSKSAGDIGKSLDIPHNLVSFHLKSLFEKGFLTRKKKGSRIYYSIKPSRRDVIESVIGLLE